MFARIPLPTPSGPPEGELPVGQEKPPWGVSPGEGIFPLLQQRKVSFFVEKFAETDCLFSGKMVFLTEIYREIGTKEEPT